MGRARPVRDAGSGSPPRVLAVDFDRVICDPETRLPGYKMGQPVEGALEALRALQSDGWRIVVHTVRAAGDDEGGHVRDWLDYFGFPWHDVTAVKPAADVYLDDRAVRFTTWEAALEVLSEL